MSSTTIHQRFTINGVLTDVTSCVLRDPTAAFGVKRTDTSAVVVAAGTALTKVATGIYEHTFTDPAAGLTYNYWVEFVYGGETHRFEKNLSAPVVDEASVYLTLSAAATIAASLPGLPKWKAAADADRQAALILATWDIDAGGPWQGRKYALEQVLEFPRVAYEHAMAVPLSGLLSPTVDGGGATVWDWDSDAGQAIVPADVQRACLYQAEAILAGSIDKVLDDQSLGIASQSVGSISVSYRDPAQVAAAIGLVSSGLCRRAAMLMKKYALRSGRIL